MGSDVAWALRNLRDAKIDYPDKPGTYDEDGNVLVAPTAIEEHRFKREYDAAHKRNECYQENIKKAYATCYEHCTPSLKAIIKGDANYPTFYANQNGVELLRKIKALCCRFDSTKQATRAIVGADKGIFLFTQRNGMSNDSYFEQFNALVDTAESYGSSLGRSESLFVAELNKMRVNKANATDQQKRQALETAKESYLAMLMLDGAHESYRPLKEELDGDYAKGSDTYPTDRNAVLRLLNQRKSSRATSAWTPRNIQREQESQEGLMFAQSNGGKPENRTCFRCGKKGHISINCAAPAPIHKARKGAVEHEQLHAIASNEKDEDGGRC